MCYTCQLLEGVGRAFDLTQEERSQLRKLTPDERRQMPSEGELADGLGVAEEIFPEQMGNSPETQS